MIDSYRKTKGLAAGAEDLRSGAISFTQQAGSTLTINPHLHMLFCNGVFSAMGKNGDERFRFRNLETVADNDVETILVEFRSTMTKLIKHAIT